MPRYVHRQPAACGAGQRHTQNSQRRGVRARPWGQLTGFRADQRLVTILIHFNSLFLLSPYATSSPHRVPYASLLDLLIYGNDQLSNEVRVFLPRSSWEIELRDENERIGKDCGRLPLAADD
uniref:PepX_C domain-containing protein n=1 Tax=Heterorhabditis bacteriophora TaxID=37862 RepID=A0A1I7XGU0_HETBA